MHAADQRGKLCRLVESERVERATLSQRASVEHGTSAKPSLDHICGVKLMITLAGCLPGRTRRVQYRVMNRALAAGSFEGTHTVVQWVRRTRCVCCDAVWWKYVFIRDKRSHGGCQERLPHPHVGSQAPTVLEFTACEEVA
jgi:hypothetical protein